MKTALTALAFGTLFAGVGLAGNDEVIGQPWSDFEMSESAVVSVLRDPVVQEKLNAAGEIRSLRNLGGGQYVIQTERCNLTALYEIVDCYEENDNSSEPTDEPLFCHRVKVVRTEGSCGRD